MIPAKEEAASVALGQITNSPVANKGLPPPPAGILSKPLTAVDGSYIPLPSPQKSIEDKAPTTLTRGRVLSGKRPRISRSKVIAKLASQRAASHLSGSTGGNGSVVGSSSKTRSSMGAAIKGGVKAGRGSLGGVMMSAKKRARRSEYSRRSKASATADADGSMDVDED